MRGESVSDGSGVCRRVGRFSWRTLIAALHQYEIQHCREAVKPTLPEL